MADSSSSMRTTTFASIAVGWFTTGTLPRFAHADLLVVGVSRIDAIAYCTWRSEHDGRPVRLPSEAEWAFAFGYGYIKALIQAVRGRDG